MFRFFSRQQVRVREAMQLERLSSMLFDLGKQIPPFSRKAALRSHLLYVLERQQIVLPSALSRLKRSSQPSAFVRAKLRERLLANPLPSPFVLRRAWAFATVAIFVFVMLFSFTYELPTTFAKRQTYVEPLSGEVMMFRASDAGAPIVSRTIMREGDTIVTGEDGRAAVYFFDDTVARLAPLSRMRIDTMFMGRISAAETLIAISLEQGKLWTNVVNLPSSTTKPVAHFGVRAGNVVVGTQQQATFSISADRDVEVTAVNQPVTVQIAGSEQTVQKAVVSPGQALRVSSSASVPVVTAAQEATDSWVEDNIALDVSYEERVLAQYRKERDRILAEFSGNPIASLQEVSEKAKLFLVNDSAERGSTLLAFATRELLAAQQAFDRSEIAAGQRFLASYQTTMETLMDGEVSLELSEQIAAHVLQHHKALALIPPTSRLYDVKEAVRAVERMTARSSTDEQHIALAQASDRLLELKALLDQVSPTLAVSYLKDYEMKAKQLLEDIALLDDATKADLLPMLYDRTSKDLALLRDLDMSVSHEVPQLSETVASVEDAVQKSAVIDAEHVQSAEPLTEDIVVVPQDTIPLPRLQLFLGGEPEQEAQ